jgi:hypothetical protein
MTLAARPRSALNIPKETSAKAIYYTLRKDPNTLRKTRTLTFSNKLPYYLV